MNADGKMFNAKRVLKLWNEDYYKSMKKMNAAKALFLAKFVKKRFTFFFYNIKNNLNRLKEKISKII